MIRGSTTKLVERVQGSPRKTVHQMQTSDVHDINRFMADATLEILVGSGQCNMQVQMEYSAKPSHSSAIRARKLNSTKETAAIEIRLSSSISNWKGRTHM